MGVPVQQSWRYLPSQLIALSIQLSALLLWARLLPLGEVGRLTIIIAIQEILFSLTASGWAHYMLRFRARHDVGQFGQTENGVLLGSILFQALLVTWLLPLMLEVGNAGSLVAEIAPERSGHDLPLG